MTENELQEAVRALCRDLRLHVFHAHDSRRSWGSGFPDLVIAGLGGVLFRELKTTSGAHSGAQRSWHYVLVAAGADSATWRPADLQSGRITRELLAIAQVRLSQ